MSFLLRKQQCQSTEGNSKHVSPFFIDHQAPDGRNDTTFIPALQCLHQVIVTQVPTAILAIKPKPEIKQLAVSARATKAAC